MGQIHQLCKKPGFDYHTLQSPNGRYEFLFEFPTFEEDGVIFVPGANFRLTVAFYCDLHELNDKAVLEPLVPLFSHPWVKKEYIVESLVSDNHIILQLKTSDNIRKALVGDSIKEVKEIPITIYIVSKSIGIKESSIVSDINTLYSGFLLRMQMLAPCVFGLFQKKLKSMMMINQQRDYYVAKSEQYNARLDGEKQTEEAADEPLIVKFKSTIISEYLPRKRFQKCTDTEIITMPKDGANIRNFIRQVRDELRSAQVSPPSLLEEAYRKFVNGDSINHFRDDINGCARLFKRYNEDSNILAYPIKDLDSN